MLNAAAKPSMSRLEEVYQQQDCTLSPLTHLTASQHNKKAPVWSLEITGCLTSGAWGELPGWAQCLVNVMPEPHFINTSVNC